MAQHHRSCVVQVVVIAACPVVLRVIRLNPGLIFNNCFFRFFIHSSNLSINPDALKRAGYFGALGLAEAKDRYLKC